MKKISFMRLAAVVLVVLAALYSGYTTQQPTTAPPPAADVRALSDVPEAAWDVYDALAENDWQPLADYHSAVFQNREQLLPQGVRYTEHDIYPHVPGKNRGAERIVYVSDGSMAYYTGDHYRTFTPMTGEGQP